MTNDKLLQTYKAHATDNEIEILRSHKCGCFFCRSVFDAREVSEWASENGGGASAICPKCGMPTVIGDASGAPLDEALLDEMYKAFYENGDATIDSAAAYVSRYLDNQITHTQESENAFERCLALLASTGNAHANFLMGQMYSGKAEFHEPNFELAKVFFADQSLHNNVHALCKLGSLYTAKVLKSKNKMEGYEYFAKALALGSIDAIPLMADCYVVGGPVKKDLSFAFFSVRATFVDLYPDYVRSKYAWDCLPDLSLRLATYYYDGAGCQKDHMMALRYFLWTKLACNFRDTLPGSNRFDTYFPDYGPIIDSSISSLAQEFGAKEGHPVCDADTFFDTYGDPDMSEDSDKTLELISYNPAEMTLSFSITAKAPGFIIDLGNLCCLPSPEKVDWNFEQVASFKLNSPTDTTFNRVRLHQDEDGWDFIRKEPSGDYWTVASVRFTPAESFKKILSSEKRKNAAEKKKQTAKKKAPKSDMKKKGKKE